MKAFFDSIRASLFGGKLLQLEVTGINAIIACFKAQGGTDQRFLAYILATAFHETRGCMEPVREGFALTNADAIAAVTRLFKAGKISKNYALPQGNGKSYYGRGLVQITHPGNYQTMGKVLNLPLYDNPDLALELDIAAKILVKGMIYGLFTGVKLATYIHDDHVDFVNARRIINGTDQSTRIAGYAAKFLTALNLVDNA